MKMLIVANPDRPESIRIVEEAEGSGHDVACLPIWEVVFETVSGRTEALAAGLPIGDFECLYLRGMYPLFSEGLTLAEMAQEAGVRVIDSFLARRNFVQSKTYAAWRLSQAGVPVPDGFQVSDADELGQRLGDVRFPAVVKGAHGSQGERVYLCRDADEAKSVALAEPDQGHIVQPLLPVAREYRLLVLGYRSLGAIEKDPPPGDFRRNVSLGGAARPASPPKELVEMAELSARTMEYEFAGVDLAVLDDGSPVVLEVNRTPGFVGFEAATGDNVARSFVEYAVRDAD